MNLLEGTPGWLSINYLDCPLVVRSHKSIAVLLLLILRKITNQLFSVLDIITFMESIMVSNATNLNCILSDLAWRVLEGQYYDDHQNQPDQVGCLLEQDLTPPPPFQ